MGMVGKGAWMLELAGHSRNGNGFRFGNGFDCAGGREFSTAVRAKSLRVGSIVPTLSRNGRERMGRPARKNLEVSAAPALRGISITGLWLPEELARISSQCDCLD